MTRSEVDDHPKSIVETAYQDVSSKNERHHHNSFRASLNRIVPQVGDRTEREGEIESIRDEAEIFKRFQQC
jgi:hypothetical protein